MLSPKFVTEKSLTIVFYISGHGYGHAVRDIEIIRALLRKNQEAVVHVRTGAAQWLFDELSERVVYHHRELDFGVHQQTSFSADREGTFRRYAELIERKEELLRQEVAFLEQVRAEMVVSDITPFAFDAAARYGKPATAVGNFSWDWIYADYLNDLPQFAFVVEDIRASYRQAARLLRIPFYGDMTAFTAIENVPLAARQAGQPKALIRRNLGFTDTGRYVLLGLRINDFEGVDWRRAEQAPVTFVAVAREVPLKNCVNIVEGTLPFVNILAACDAVLSKPGYSMVSEVIANRTPLLYVPRRDFAEDPVLIQGLRDYAVCEELPQEQFRAGDWSEALGRLLAKPAVWPIIRTDGAEVIAGKLLAGAPHRKRRNKFWVRA